MNDSIVVFVLVICAFVELMVSIAAGRNTQSRLELVALAASVVTLLIAWSIISGVL